MYDLPISDASSVVCMSERLKDYEYSNKKKVVNLNAQTIFWHKIKHNELNKSIPEYYRVKPDEVWSHVHSPCKRIDYESYIS